MSVWVLRDMGGSLVSAFGTMPPKNLASMIDSGASRSTRFVVQHWTPCRLTGSSSQVLSLIAFLPASRVSDSID